MPVRGRAVSVRTVVTTRSNIGAKMETLPIEIIGNILENLDTETLKSVSCVNHEYHSLATPYLAKEVHVTYHVDELRWLRKIADNPQTAPKVRTIYFECDRLPYAPEKDDWLKYVIDEYIRVPKPKIPEPDMYGHVNLEDQFKYYSDLHTFRNQDLHDYDEMELDVGWQEFCKYTREIQRIWEDQSSNGPWTIGDNILAKLPNVHTLIFDSNETFRPQSQIWQSHFRSGLTHRADFAEGVFQQALVWLVHIGAYCRMRPTTLLLGLQFWDSLIIQQGIRDLPGAAARIEFHWTAICYAVECLRHLEMSFTTMPETEYDSPYDEIEACYNFIQEFPRLHQMIAAAPELEHLALVFRPNWHAFNDERTVFYEDCDIPIYPPDRTRHRYMARLEDCFQTTQWNFLTNLKLWGVESQDDEQLIAFFRRHALLQRLDLKNLGLRKGSWLTVFEAIREPARVSTCVLAGEFHSRGAPEEIWDLERPTENGNGVFDEEREKRRTDLQEWMCNRPRRPAPATGTAVEWRRIWGLGLEGVGYPWMSPLRWHLKP
ncbi:hypothetical protein MMC32_007369 [Xylographa parallela]|nr:hypothetical protein [Xylographa parallela]